MSAGKMATTEVATEQAKGLQIEAPFKDRPNARPLLISATRPRAFLERAARELLAGGIEELVLSAMGDAIGRCIHLALTLQEKDAIKIEKIVTERNTFKTRSYTPSLRILVTRHPNFRGSRIPPAYVQFSSGKDAPEVESGGRLVTVIPGNLDFKIPTYYLDDRLMSVFSSASIAIPDFEKLLLECFEASLSRSRRGSAPSVAEEAPPRQQAGGQQRAQLFDNSKAMHPSAKAVMCRLGVDDADVKVGSVIILALQTTTTPPQASVVVYLALPPAENYEATATLASYTKKIGINLMTALCDFNGLAQREGQRLKLKRVPMCRIPLLYPQNKIGHHSINEVVLATLKGMDEGYCHGPSPRLLFTDPKLLYKQEWTRLTGFESNDAPPATPSQS